MTVLIGFMPKITTVTTNDVETDEWSIGIAGDTRRFWIYALIAVVCILGFVLIFKKIRFSYKSILYYNNRHTLLYNSAHKRIYYRLGNRIQLYHKADKRKYNKQA